MAKLRIGLLGGSFNPAHGGHLHISLEAIKRLKLDRIWWLVSPQNPLKPTQGMAPYAERLASARAVTQGHRQIMVSDFEQKMGLHYTYATLRALKQRYPGVKFVWIMGADNLTIFHRWQRWRNILKLMPVAVFDRAPFSHRSLRGVAATAFKSMRLPQHKIASIARRSKRWVYMYLLTRRHDASSTQIRASREKKPS